jgi:amino acid adenylation domain-containing protein
MAQRSEPFISQVSHQSHEAILQYQQNSLHELLQHVWKHSSFYRDYYESCGIRERDLPYLTVSDLPLVSKKALMEHFDEAITDPNLKKQQIEEWIHECPDPGQRYLDDFIILHTSGSSGDIAIFVYDLKTWQLMSGIVTSHFPHPENYPDGRTRVACYLAMSGHFGGVTSAALLPRTVYDVVVASVLDPPETVVKQLNEFQPHRLIGYPSSMALLADLALGGKLTIQPQMLFVGGEMLTESIKEKVQSAWQVPIWEMYSASESIYLAIRKWGDEDMTVVNDLNILEVLDQNHRLVPPGKSGRVVITNLYNYVLPVLRYELGDYAIRGKGALGPPITAIRGIQGRVNDALPVMLDSGELDSIHPLVLSEFHAAGLQNVQFTSRRPDHVEILYVARENIDESAKREFRRILELKKATRTTFDVRRVEQIDIDARTGKLPLVVKSPESVSDNIARSHSKQSHVSATVADHADYGRATDGRSAEDYDLQLALKAKCFHPTGNFIDFKMSEIEQSIAARFEQVVRKYPDRIAVKTNSHELTYDALNRVANRVARAIVEKRGNGEEPVALLLEKNAPMIAAILAVLKASKIYMPVDPSYPRARISAMLEDSQAALILTDNRNLTLAGEVSCHKRPLINFDEIGSGVSSENLGLTISPDNLASILYTSGSTGEPKGVVQNHRNILYKTRTYTNNLRFCPDDRISLLSPCTFSLSVGFIFGSLLNGACLLPMDIREEGFSHLGNWLTQENITVFNAVPTSFRSFIDSLTTQEKFPALRVIHMGGAATRRDFELFKSHFSAPCIMVHDLGSNESGTIAQYFIDHTTEIHGNTVPGGYAVEGGEILILDDTGSRLPREHVGEITLKSRHVALGYWRKPELTRAVFSPDPTRGQERIYRTGDLGFIRYDGCLQYLGRKDFQVKIRGHRVELAEIEVALVEFAGIKEAVVVAQEEAPDEMRLVAYVVSKLKIPPTVSRLRNFLKGKLPEFMVPSAIMFLDGLPLTPSGKVDRQALPPPDWTQSGRGENFALPGDQLERTIAGVWQDVLQVERVGIYDNFFDLGGHSLRLLAVYEKLRRLTDQEFSVIDLLKHPTISSFTQFLSQVETVQSSTRDLERAANRRANLGRQRQTRQKYRAKARPSKSEDE